jgi:hypothetical protein
MKHIKTFEGFLNESMTNDKVYKTFINIWKKFKDGDYNKLKTQLESAGLKVVMYSELLKATKTLKEFPPSAVVFDPESDPADDFYYASDLVNATDDEHWDLGWSDLETYWGQFNMFQGDEGIAFVYSK